MAKIDPYLRSIEKFGAAGAVLTSGQPITLKFPAGDRNATQVVGHDLLVQMVREIAPPPALDQVDSGKPTRFDYDSNGARYAIAVQPRPGAWQVVIEGAPAAAAPPRTPRAPSPAAASAASPGSGDAGELAIERGQYAEGAAAVAAPTASGSPFLDAITQAARGARASDVVIATGAPPLVRTNGKLEALADRGALDAETVSRELGGVAPADARAAWIDRGGATFTYGDGMGRVRATLSRDHRGPGATLRLLVGDPPAPDRIGLPREVGGWLDQRGLVIVAGTVGSGKTTTLAALVKALGERGRRVIAIEDPIELVHASPWISQRAVGDHVASLAAGIAMAQREGPDAIAIGAIPRPEDAVAIIEAVAADTLVLVTLGAPADRAADHLVDLLPGDRKELGRAVIARGFLGAVAGVVQGANRRFEVVARPD